jgi:hypothetical protein
LKGRNSYTKGRGAGSSSSIVYRADIQRLPCSRLRTIYPSPGHLERILGDIGVEPCTKSASSCFMCH